MSLLLGVSVAALIASPAAAQTIPETAPPEEQVDAPAAPNVPQVEDSEETGTIVVTGSRIPSVTPFNSPDPDVELATMADMSPVWCCSVRQIAPPDGTGAIPAKLKDCHA